MKRARFVADFVRVAIQIEGKGYDNGHVAIMQFITRGIGSNLPDGARWEDRASGIWERPPNEWNINSEVARSFSQPGGPRATGWRLMAEAEKLPTDREQRHAWRDNGKIEVDAAAAKQATRASP